MSFHICNNKTSQMSSRLNWKPEEDRLLKHLREVQNIKSWQKIAQILTNQFISIARSPKQCRERYSNTAKFSGETHETKPWNEKEDQMLKDLYLQNGSKWSLFVGKFDCRSENSIKNRFNCCLRKAARKLGDLQEKITDSKRRSIKYEMLMTILDLANHVEREAQSITGQKLPPNLNLLKLRESILKITFSESFIASQDVNQIVQSLHKINAYLRTLGVFKIKKNTEWQLTRNRLQYILSFEDRLDFMTTLAKTKIDSKIGMWDSTNLDNLDVSIELKVQQGDSLVLNFHCGVEQEMGDILGFLADESGDGV